MTEILVGHLLTALGFEGSEVIGKTGDRGVDATGELNVANLAKVKVFVQAKRYKLGSRITANTVRQLRQAIPFGGQGAFITTADFQNTAHETALEQGFPRIGLVNGRQLVDLLVEHWEDIPAEFQTSLGLKRGLVLTRTSPRGSRRSRPRLAFEACLFCPERPRNRHQWKTTATLLGRLLHRHQRFASLPGLLSSRSNFGCTNT
jgi:hypothetical protein